MLNIRESKRSARIELTRRNIEVALGGSETQNLFLVYPPVDELEDIRDSYSPTITLREAMLQDPFDLRSIFSYDLEVMKEKESRFKESSTYLNQLANLSSLVDDERQARQYLKTAIKYDDVGFFSNQVARSYANEGNLAAAVEFLDNPGLATDINSLTLSAQLALANQDVMQARELIDSALSIDRIDSDANIIKGGLCLMGGQPQLAVRHYRTAINETRVSSNVFVNLAVCHFLLGHPHKAARSLSNAITVNPANENAVVFYADVLFELNMSGGEIGPLLRLVDFDSKSDVAWNRLGRSYYVNQKYNRALEALKHEVTLTNNPAAWNNIAVTHWRNSDYLKSEKYYNYALRLASENLSEHGQIAFGIIRNLASHYLSLDQFGQALKTARAGKELAIENGFDDSGIAVSLITAVLRTNGIEAAVDTAQDFLDRQDLDVNVRLEIIARLIGMHGEFGSSSEDVAPLLVAATSYLDADENIPERILFHLTNNMMFTFLQLDMLEKADFLSRKLSKYVLEDPFTTATFGLLNLKKGRIKKGKELYNSAIGIARDRKLKDQIRQRQNLELGRQYLKIGDNKKASVALHRAVSEKLGLDYVAGIARILTRRLEKPRM